MKSRFVLAAVLLQALGCVSLAAAAGLPGSVLACREVDDPERRLACYDAAVDRAPEASVSTPPDEKPPSPAPASADGSSTVSVADTGEGPANAEDPLSAERLFGKSGVEVRQSVQKATGTKEIDKIEATVTKVQYDASGKVVVTLDNGQVWRQIDTSRIRLSKKNTVVIQRASLGSFLLTKSGSKRSVRVRRTS